MNCRSVTKDQYVAVRDWLRFIPPFPDSKFRASGVFAAVVIRGHIVFDRRSVNKFVLSTVDFDIKIQRQLANISKDFFPDSFPYMLEIFVGYLTTVAIWLCGKSNSYA